ncbi:Hsp20/alpha crystallin family protein [Phenylobacterium sp. LjRoot219]|uniref:Hsp20/alpha crystallin family protein n=1 Tax=Phenylobacterium sp. LjRoot219 TaxID=3342283 RepID=UPI003F4F7E2C
MNVSETDGELRISAELPGVDEKHVELTLDGDMLTIRGEKKFEQEHGGEEERYHYVERAYGSFQRSVQIPYSVKSEDVRAEFHNGVLTLTLPKSEQQQRTRKIPIGAGAPRHSRSPAAGRKARSRTNRRLTAASRVSTTSPPPISDDHPPGFSPGGPALCSRPAACRPRIRAPGRLEAVALQGPRCLGRLSYRLASARWGFRRRTSQATR